MGSERLAVMVEFPRKADGRRVFSVAFKRETVARITSGEKTLAELSRARHFAECRSKLDASGGAWWDDRGGGRRGRRAGQPGPRARAAGQGTTAPFRGRRGIVSTGLIPGKSRCPSPTSVGAPTDSTSPAGTETS